MWERREELEGVSERWEERRFAGSSTRFFVRFDTRIMNYQKCISVHNPPRLVPLPHPIPICRCERINHEEIVVRSGLDNNELIIPPP